MAWVLMLVCVAVISSQLHCFVKWVRRSCISLTMEAIVVNAAERRVYRLDGTRLRIIVSHTIDPWMLVYVGQDLFDRDLWRTASFFDYLRNFSILVLLELWTELVSLSQVVKLYSCLLFTENGWKRLLFVFNDRNLLFDNYRLYRL